MTAEKPIHEIRLARIKVSLWANHSDNGTRYNATVCRLYRDGDAWKTSDSFGRDELPLVIKALDIAYTWMLTTGVSASLRHSEYDISSHSHAGNGGAQ